jgi:hypothetical protein
MIKHCYTNLLLLMKKERRFFAKEFENNYKLGNPATDRGLRYDQEYRSVCLETVPKEFNLVEEIEEIMVVSEEWVILAGFVRGVVEHVISMDSGCGFSLCPNGAKFG